MDKTFNTVGTCIIERHYMVDNEKYLHDAVDFIISQNINGFKELAK